MTGFDNVGLGGVGAINGSAAVDDILSSAQATPAAAPAAAAGKDKLAKMGSELYRNLTTEQKLALSSNSGKVHFICPMATYKMKAQRQQTKAGGSTITRTNKDGKTYTGKEMETINTYAIVGYKFKTDIDLKVPKIPFEKPPYDTQKVYPLDKCEWQEIKAGSEFVLTRVEALYMMVMPELLLNGYCAYGDDEKGVQIACRLNNEFVMGERIPTPVLKLVDQNKGSIKENMDFIDDPNATALKPEYAEKFADVYRVRAGAKTSDGLPASAAKPCTCASLAIYNILQGGK
jgi:hypothetical protein